MRCYIISSDLFGSTRQIWLELNRARKRHGLCPLLLKELSLAAVDVDLCQCRRRCCFGYKHFHDGSLTCVLYRLKHRTKTTTWQSAHTRTLELRLGAASEMPQEIFPSHFQYNIQSIIQCHKWNEENCNPPIVINSIILVTSVGRPTLTYDIMPAPVSNTAAMAMEKTILQLNGLIIKSDCEHQNTWITENNSYGAHTHIHMKF